MILKMLCTPLHLMTLLILQRISAALSVLHVIQHSAAILDVPENSCEVKSYLEKRVRVVEENNGL
jgi:hypothetical protein